MAATNPENFQPSKFEYKNIFIVFYVKFAIKNVSRIFPQKRLFLEKKIPEILRFL